MINTVRNTVLSILNKNNYGYLSPSDFNLFAQQAQVEIFENYFSEYNTATNKENARLSGTDFADLKQKVQEDIESFYVTKNLTQFIDNQFYLPSISTTGDEFIRIIKVLCYIAGVPRVFKGEAEKVNQRYITMLVNSNITKPTAAFPSYVMSENKLTVYPEGTFNAPTSIECQYIRYPKIPKWTYVSLFNGSPMFDQTQSDYQDFELPQEDAPKLITKILQYAGVSIREAEVINFAQVEEQKDKQQQA